ncbi:hypothetical protein E4U19_006275 [Claviceps sp. Clav32 group G5]|nr:hypothetical protein E4U19_006275 [Claviceps sp. Clav32 group G5]
MAVAVAVTTPTKAQKLETSPRNNKSTINKAIISGPLDESCPSAQDYGSEHINRDAFLRLFREQLAVDCVEDADCMPVNASGWIGSLFMIRLLSHGYTLLAKGVQLYGRQHLEDEEKMSDLLRLLKEPLHSCLSW